MRSGLNVAGAGHFDYHNHFIPLSMLLSPSPALDLGATTPKYIYNLGLVQWLLLIPAAMSGGAAAQIDASGKIAAVLRAGHAVLCLSDHTAVCVLVGPRSRPPLSCNSRGASSARRPSRWR